MNIIENEYYKTVLNIIDQLNKIYNDRFIAFNGQIITIEVDICKDMSENFKNEQNNEYNNNKYNMETLWYYVSYFSDNLNICNIKGYYDCNEDNKLIIYINIPNI